MNTVLVLGECDASGALQNATLELLTLARARQLPADVVVEDGDRPRLVQELSAHGAGRVWFLTGDVSRYSARKLACAIDALCQKTGADSLWGSTSQRARDLLSYCAGLAGGDVLNAVRGLEKVGDAWVAASESHAGRVLRKDTLSSRFTSLAFASTGVAAVARADAAPAVAEAVDVKGGDLRFTGDLIPPEKEEGIQLKDAEVVLDLGAGVGSKGIAEAKKLLNVLLATGTKAALGGTRVVTDAGLLPRAAQIGVSGISVPAKLILSVGASGAPQHWVGIKDCGSIVAVNTDAEAPLMRMADLPIQGDGLAFLKELGTLISSTLTDAQKEAVKKAAEARRAKPAATSTAGPSALEMPAEAHEALSDAPLKVDLRSLEFDAFHVYKVDQLDAAWNREKLSNLLRKVAKYAETFLNQGKRTAEQIHCRFLPGEGNEQRAVVTPPGLKEAFQEYYRSGLGRFHVPRRFGGLELPHGFLDLVSEIVNAGSVAMGTGFELTQGASLILQNFGSEWMQDVLIPGLYDGRFQGTMCLTEPQAGSDLGAVTTTAERHPGTDTFRINGTKVFITAGDHDMAENFIHIVLAKLRGVSQKGTRAISLFMVPKFWIDEEGHSGEFNRVVTQSIEHKHGMTTSPTCVLKFDNARGLLIARDVEEEMLQPSGMKNMFFMMNYMRHETGTAARAQAMATCLDTLIYNTEREQGLAVCDMGGQKRVSPIFHHSGQKKIMLDMFARTLGGRGLTLRLTEVRDASDRHLEHEMAAVEQETAALDLSSDQRRRIAEIEKDLAGVERRLGKVESGRSAFRRDPAALAAIAKEQVSLQKRRESLRAALGAVSAKYLALQDRAAQARRDQADEETYASIYTSLVKAQVTDDTIRTLNDGMNACGGIGFMAETPVSQRLKDSQVLCIWEGTNDIQALNTVGRQISPDNKDSRGRVVFERLLAEIRAFISLHRVNPAFAESLAVLDGSVNALERFRNAMARATPADRRNYKRRMFGSVFARPDRAAETAAEGRWAEMVQASARNFSAYFAQIVQAWQLLRMGVAADRLLHTMSNGAEPSPEDRQFDEPFLRGRVLLANHFVFSPNCLDKNLLQWERQFYRSVPWELKREELSDAAERITLA
jgi:alkylation response protein AidB-like acyl-CoA dehydrogenase/electron transfer flavoprotein alpha subunit